MTKIVIYPEINREVIIRTVESSTLYVNIQFDKSERISEDHVRLYNKGVLVAETSECDDF